jgi:nucleotide-binding universal stress UspA family protein
MFGTIVVAVDGSRGAARAVETAAKIAAGTNDQVVVCHGVVVSHAWGGISRPRPLTKRSS